MEKLVEPVIDKLGVELWFWRYSRQEVADLEATNNDFLNEKEKVRLSGLVSNSRRADYLVGRWMVKKIVHRVKPVEGNQRDDQLSFSTSDLTSHSISHSKGVVALALAKYCIGLDIEANREKNKKLDRFDKLVTRFFSEKEQQLYFKSDDEVRHDYFLKIWTQKEAYYKYKYLAEKNQPINFFGLMSTAITGKLEEKKDKLATHTFFSEEYACRVSVVVGKN